MLSRDLFLTALAPAIWGSSYIVTTNLLPGHSPFVVALLRALPAGLLLLLFVRRLPPLLLRVYAESLQWQIHLSPRTNALESCRGSGAPRRCIE